MGSKPVVCVCVWFGCALPAAAQWTECADLYRQGAEARKMGRYRDARRLLETALAESGLDGLDVRRAQLDGALATVCERLGDANRAERLYSEAAAILQSRPEPAIESVILGDFGSFRESQGRLDEAEKLLLRAIEASRAGFGDGHPQTAAAHAALGHLYLTSGRLSDAEPLLRKAVEVQRSALAAADIERVMSESSLGVVYSLQHRYADAEAVLQPVSRAALDLGEDHPVYAMTLVNLADLYRLEGNPVRGEPLLRKALAIYEASMGPDSPAVADALLDMSITTIHERKSSLAASQIRRALEILKKIHGPEHTTVAVGECRLAQSLVIDRRYADARKLLEHAVPILERTFPGGHPVLTECATQLTAKVRR